MLYHILDANETSIDITDDEKKKIMSDEYLYFESESSTGAIAVNEKAKVMNDNILASNGVIYIFDTLLFLPRVDIEIIYLRCYFNITTLLAASAGNDTEEMNLRLSFCLLQVQN